jgi:hypothetical protein
MRTTFGIEVVPSVVLYRITRSVALRAARRQPKSRHADERGEMAVLVGQ